MKRATTMFDWESFHKYQEKMTDVEREVIRRHFFAMMEGNSHYSEMDRGESESHLATFKQAWIMARMFTEGHSLGKD